MTGFWPGRIAIAAMLALALALAGETAGDEPPWWLNVFFLIDGEWVSGGEIHGWSPRAFDSEAECFERKAYAEARCAESPLDHPAEWICSKGEPLSEPPEHLRGVYC